MKDFDYFSEIKNKLIEIKNEAKKMEKDGLYFSAVE